MAAFRSGTDLQVGVSSMLLPSGQSRFHNSFQPCQDARQIRKYWSKKGSYSAVLGHAKIDPSLNCRHLPGRQILGFAVGLAVIAVPQVFPALAAIDNLMAAAAVKAGMIYPESAQCFAYCAHFSLNSLLLFVVALFLQRDNWASLGFSQPSLGDPFLGFGASLLYEFSIPFLMPLLSSPRLIVGALNGVVRRPLERWFLARIAFDAFFEELSTRAYVIEHIFDLTGSLLASGVASLCFAIALHIPSLGFNEAILRAPFLFILTVLYLLRRNILPCIVAHILMNTLFVLAMIHAVWMITWLEPDRVWLILVLDAVVYFILRRFPMVVRRVSETSRVDKSV